MKALDGKGNGELVRSEVRFLVTVSASAGKRNGCQQNARHMRARHWTSRPRTGMVKLNNQPSRLTAGFVLSNWNGGQGTAGQGRGNDVNGLDWN